MSAAAAKQAPCTLRATCGGSLFNAASGVAQPAAWAVSLAGCECIERSAIGHSLDEAVLDFVQGLAAVPLPDPPPVLRALLGHTLDEVLLRGITALYSLVGYDLPEHPDEDGEFLVANEANSWLTRRYNILAEEEARLGPNHPSVVRRREVLKELTRALRRGQLPQELSLGSDAEDADNYTGSGIFADLDSPNPSQVIANEDADVGRPNVESTENLNDGRTGSFSQQAENQRTDNHRADNGGAETRRSESNRADNNGEEIHRAENNQGENHPTNDNGAETNRADNSGAENHRTNNNGTENHIASNNGAENYRENNNGAGTQRADTHRADNNRAENRRNGTACLPCSCTGDSCTHNSEEQQDREQELTGFPPRNNEYVAMPAWMLPGVNFEDIDRDSPSEEELLERQRRRSGSRRHSRTRDTENRHALEDLFFRRPPTTVYPALVPGAGALPADSPSSESQGDSGTDLPLTPVCNCCMSQTGEQEAPCRCSGPDEHPDGVCVCSCHWEDPVCGHGSTVCVCIEPSSDYFTGAQITPHTSSHSARGVQEEEAAASDDAQEQSAHERSQQAERRRSASIRVIPAEPSTDNLRRQPASINLPISEVEAPVTDNISEMSRRQRSASAAASLPSREGAGESPATKSTKTAPCRCPEPAMRPEQILWATTKIYVYADNSRTYEVLTPSFEKPLWVKGRTHVLFAMKSPPKSIGDGAG